MQVRALIVMALVAAAGVSAVRADVVLYDSDGFESVTRFPAFTPLDGVTLDSAKWKPYGNVNASSITSRFAASGTRSATVTRNLGVSMWGPDTNFNPTGPAKTILVEWDQRVEASTNNPFYGIFAYNGNTLVAMTGIDGTTGQLMVSDATGTTAAVDPSFTATPGTWHHYRLQLRYAQQQYSLAIDGIARGGARAFAHSATQFTDALYATWGLNNGLASTGSSYFDNYRVSALIDGDTNHDNVVDLADLNTLRSHFGATGQTWESGDVNGDGTVDVKDFNALKANFGVTMPVGGDAALADNVVQLPEPGGATVVAGLALAAMARRRKRE